MSYFNTLHYHQDAVASIQSDAQSITYAELCMQADTLAAVIGRRTLVFSLCTNSIASVVGYVGFLRNSIVPVLLDSNLDAQLLKNLIKVYEPAYIWCPKLAVARIGGTVCYSYKEYVLMRTEYSDTWELYPDLGLLMTTSGSTGSPKLVRQSYANIEANTNAIITYLHITSSGRPITTLPMNYTYGLSIITSHLTAGATLLLTQETLLQKRFWTFLQENKATTFGGVPYTYHILDRLQFFTMDIPSIKYLTQAGGKLSDELSLKFATMAKEKNIEFIAMYGQTEATARMSYLPAERAIDKCGSIGIAIPKGKLWLEDEKGACIEEAGKVGELVYRGANVTLGYAQCKADLALGDERKGVLATGDLAMRDNDGFYYIVGRKRRFIKIFGNRVNLDETERLLQDKGFICACSGTDDTMVVYTEDAGQEEEIQTLLSTLLQLHKSAFTVKHIVAIPKNEAGKTLYAELENVDV